MDNKTNDRGKRKNGRKTQCTKWAVWNYFFYFLFETRRLCRINPQTIPDCLSLNNFKSFFRYLLQSCGAFMSVYQSESLDINYFSFLIFICYFTMEDRDVQTLLWVMDAAMIVTGCIGFEICILDFSLWIPR